MGEWQRDGAQEGAGLGEEGLRGRRGWRQHPKVSQGLGMGGRLLPEEPGSSPVRQEVLSVPPGGAGWCGYIRS